MSTFDIRVGDTMPWLAYRVGVDLSDVTSVTFSARDLVTDETFIDDKAAMVANGSYALNGKMVTLTPEDGVLFYQWDLADTAIVRRSCECLFHLFRAGGAQETYPATSYIRVVIRENF